MGQLFANDKFCEMWRDVYSAGINDVLAANQTAAGVREIGRRLYELFYESYQEWKQAKPEQEPSRSQSDLSRGGRIWESMVSWYLNLGLVATSCVAVKWNKSLVPRRLQDALAVSVQDVPSNSATDILAIGFGFGGVDPVALPEDDLAAVVEALNRQLVPAETTLGVLECKTNWNDNAVVPMLWNAVYSQLLKGGAVADLSVGRNGMHLGDFRRFFYSFVAVPTSSPKGGFKPTLSRVTRLASLTGGRFWALPEERGVAKNISEMFRDTRTFGPLTADWDVRLTAQLRARQRPEFHLAVLSESV